MILAPTTLNGLLERAATFPQAGLRFLDRRERPSWESWAEIHTASQRVAAGLRQLGVGTGDRVALVFATGPAFFHAFFGTLFAGAVPVPLYPPVRLGRLDEYQRRTAAMLRAASARLVLAEGRVGRLLGPAIADAQPDFGCRTLDRLPAASAIDSPEVDPDALALVQFSSGTTVDPKPVALSHRAVVAQTRILNSFWPDQDGIHHSGVSWLPLYHDMGLIGCVFPALERPSVLTLIPPELFVVRPAVWLRALSRYRATVSPAPNFAYGLVVEKVTDEELEGVDLSNWRVALNGAEPIAPNILRRFQRRFAAWGLRPEALTPVYGLSEASLAVTFSELGRPFESRCFDREALAEGEAKDQAEGRELPSVGRPIPGFELKITDDDGTEIAVRRVGHVRVRGPSIMEGYLDRPEATAEVLADGWLATGDLGFVDEAGELYLTGRAKDAIILRGRNYSPSDVEQATGELEGVRRGCVVAVSYLPEDAASEELLVFVEGAKDAEDDVIEDLPEAVETAILTTTGLKADHVYVLEPGTLPRTSSGKLRRGETLRHHLAGTLEPPRRVTPVLVGGALARSALAYARARRRRSS
jgi:fatty-acyl-CoA synthase